MTCVKRYSVSARWGGMAAAVLLSLFLVPLTGCGASDASAPATETEEQSAQTEVSSEEAETSAEETDDTETDNAEDGDKTEVEIDEEDLDELLAAEDPDAEPTSKEVLEADVSEELAQELPETIELDEELDDADAADSKASAPSLSSASVQRALNILVSNFTETGLGVNVRGYTFDRTYSPMEDWAYLAFFNYWQNGGKPQDVSGSTWNVRVATSKLDAITIHLTDRQVNSWANLNGRSEWFSYKSGCVYTQVTNGYPLYGPAVVTSARTYGSNQLVISFSAFYYPAGQTGYRMGDGSQYSMTERQVSRLLGVDGPNRYGEALVEYYRQNGAWKFKMVRMHLYG